MSRDIIVTVPKSVSWDDYLKELEAVKDGSQTMYFKVPTLPVESEIGRKCYIVHDGRVRGFMIIVEMRIIPCAWRCSTTGKVWDAGSYIGRSGPFYQLTNQHRMRGFQGFRYYDGL